jgi:hypothetical protein
MGVVSARAPPRLNDPRHPLASESVGLGTKPSKCIMKYLNAVDVECSVNVSTEC